MNKKTEFRRSIWEQNQHYKTKHSKINFDLIPIIDTIQSVEAAKKRTPPIPLNELVKIAEISKNLPPPSKITVKQFKELLNTFDCYGAGIKTIIAIIARVSKGKYPPIDKKILAGLRRGDVITEEEETALNGNTRRKIASIYVEKVLPKWRRELAKGKLPKDIDEEWARE